MEKNLKIILPFLKMENLDYVPYLGIVNFINTKKEKDKRRNHKTI